MTTGISYRNTFTSMPGWLPGSLADQPRGYAYESGGRFIHVFGRERDQWVISSGLTFSQETREESLEQWTERVFAAQDVRPLQHDVGTVIDGVWRPGLYWEDQVFQALSTNRVERLASEHALHGLIERLNELLLFIEPERAGLDAYGPRSRELLILAATEAENTWKHYMRRARVNEPSQGFRTTDYVRLCEPLHLREYQVSLAPYAHAPSLRPFETWDTTQPTQSLAWYDAYNKTKHDRATHLSAATVRGCLEAVAAGIVLFCVRFGPFSLSNPATPLSSLVNQLFSVELVNCEPSTFYLPLVELPPTWAADRLTWGDSRPHTKPWTIMPLRV